MPELPPADRLARHLPQADRLAAWVFRRGRWRDWRPEARDHAVDALRRAVQDYDPARGDFESFAVACILAALRKFRTRCARKADARPKTQSLDLLADHEAVGHTAPAGLPAELLANLTPGQRDVLHRRFVLGQTFREIALARRQKTGRPDGRTKCASAHRQYRRALAALKARLATTTGPRGYHT